MPSTIELEPSLEIAALEATFALESAEDLYLPRNGKLTPQWRRDEPDCTVYGGVYATPVATHEVRVYKPPNYVDGKNPVVVTSPPWLTGTDGHMDGVARHFVSLGAAVLEKGTPRYYGPRVDSLTFAEDANELLGLVQRVRRKKILGELGDVRFYGESQSAGKAYSGLAIASFYNLDVTHALAVAPVSPEPITIVDVPELLPQVIDEVLGIIAVARKLSLKELFEHLGTFSIQDAHHHAAVLRHLVSGDPGLVVPHIPKDQQWKVLFGAKDRQSRPEASAAQLKAHLPGVKTEIIPRLGHITMIRSPETREAREQLVAAV